VTTYVYRQLCSGGGILQNSLLARIWISWNNSPPYICMLWSLKLLQSSLSWDLINDRTKLSPHYLYHSSLETAFISWPSLSLGLSKSRIRALMNFVCGYFYLKRWNKFMKSFFPFSRFADSMSSLHYWITWCLANIFWLLSLNYLSVYPLLIE